MHIDKDGPALIPTRPGWGANLDEAVARKHPWQPGRRPGYPDAKMHRGS